MKLLTIIGARPQFIKAAAVSRILQQKENIKELLVHTGQHFDDDMSAVFFDELGIPTPKYNLEINGGGHGEQTGKMLEAIEAVLLTEKPDMVMVYGDTNSTLAGALAAAKLHIPIAHVEAGLRSFNRKMPEEINRVLTDHSSDFLFAPTKTAIDNLDAEGIAASKLFKVGDVMFDATLYYGNKAETNSTILSRLQLTAKKFTLATIHRAENTDDLPRLKQIFNHLELLAKTNQLVMPLHPRTGKALGTIGFSIENSNIRFIGPVGYLDMMKLEKYSNVIITDSGGVQKEAYFHQVPCITLRDETEWVELLKNGWNVLSSPESLSSYYEKAMATLVKNNESPYGNGDAAQKIAAVLETF